jgi:hypothetical protein
MHGAIDVESGRLCAISGLKQLRNMVIISRLALINGAYADADSIYIQNCILDD